jgi:hypothetical protein
MLAVIIFSSNNSLRFVDTVQRTLEGNTNVDRWAGALNTIILTIHGTSYHGLSIITYGVAAMFSN